MTIGRIYMIYDNTNDNVYIGSTTNTLKQRLQKHETSYKRYLKGNYHYVSFVIF